MKYSSLNLAKLLFACNANLDFPFHRSGVQRDHGYGINVKNYNLPLRRALSDTRPGIPDIKLVELLAFSSNLESCNDEKQTPLGLAVALCSELICESLLDAGIFEADLRRFVRIGGQLEHNIITPCCLQWEILDLRRLVKIRSRCRSG